MAGLEEIVGVRGEHFFRDAWVFKLQHKRHVLATNEWMPKFSGRCWCAMYHERILTRQKSCEPLRRSRSRKPCKWPLQASLTAVSVSKLLKSERSFFVKHAFFRLREESTHNSTADQSNNTNSTQFELEPRNKPDAIRFQEVRIENIRMMKQLPDVQIGWRDERPLQFILWHARPQAAWRLLIFPPSIRIGSKCETKLAHGWGRDSRRLHPTN